MRLGQFHYRCSLPLHHLPCWHPPGPGPVYCSRAASRLLLLHMAPNPLLPKLPYCQHVDVSRVYSPGPGHVLMQAAGIANRLLLTLNGLQ
jgi:hypothetical protein